MNGSKRALSDKWNEVHYVIEVVLPIACCRQAEYHADSAHVFVIARYLRDRRRSEHEAQEQ